MTEITKSDFEENRLCKYILTFESWVWSIVTLPLIIFKYVNFVLLSIVRLGWLPTSLYIWFYCVLPLRVVDANGKLLDVNTGSILFWFVVVAVIILVGVVSWMYVLVENPPYKEYLKSKWLW